MSPPRLTARRALSYLVFHAEEMAGVTLVLAIGVIVLNQVARRYLLGSATGWSEELSRVLLAWVTFIGASGVVRLNAHPRMVTLRDSLRGPARVFFDVLADVSLAALALCGAYYGFSLALQVTAVKLVTLNVSWTWWYGAFPVGASLMVLRILERNWGLISTWNRGEASGDPARDGA